MQTGSSMASDLNPEDYEWQPPSEAEMKIIQARRERSDKISKIMGDYLLKGYKMLGDSCQCGTILLRNRQGKDYCVACNELDSDTDKDNPVLSSEAARAQARETQYQRLASGQTISRQLDQEEMMVEGLLEATVPNCSPVQGHEPGVTRRNQNTYSKNVLEEKLKWATEELKRSSSVEYSIQLCQLMKSCGETLVVLQSLQN